MRAFVPRVPPADDRRTVASKTSAAWTHAFQRTADPRAGFASAADGRLALDDFHASGAGEPHPDCHAALVAVARVPASATRVSVAVEVAIEALELRLVARAGLASARLRLELVVMDGDDGDELASAAIDLAELKAVGPDVDERPAPAAALRVPLACSWTMSPPAAREVHVMLRARWDVDCGVDGQLFMRGRAIARPPVITATGGAATTGRTAPPPRRRSLPF